MIVRARPKFMGGVESARYLYKREKFSEVDDSGFFFGSGRAALKFMLSCYSECLGRPVKVMLQAFNCTVVRDAVVESGNAYLLCDIGLEDFSVRLETLKRSEQFDVLLLLHYQGIPNMDYVAIADFCKVNGVLLVEDLAHGDRSTIDGVRIGTLSDVRLYSYAFDKPITAMSGGRIVLGDGVSNSKLHSLLAFRYRELPVESDASSLKDLKLLFFLYRYTGREYYHAGLNYYGLLRMLSSLNWQLLFLFSKMRIFKFLSYLFSMVSKKRVISVFRLAPRKIALIQEQERVMSSLVGFEVSRLESKLSAMGAVCVDRAKNAEIFWNRYSLLDAGGLKQALRSVGVEAGNFNWPSVLCQEKDLGAFPKAEYAARQIINIPIWTEMAEIDV